MNDAIEAFKTDVLDQLRIMRGMLTNENSTDQIDPMLVLRTPDHKMSAIMVPQFKECGKHLAGIIRRLVGHFAADRVYILAESWIRNVDIDSTDRRMPSECEDRKEAITVYALDRDTSSLYCAYQIIERHPDGKPHFPHEPIVNHEPSGKVAGGRFPSVSDLWDIKDSQQSERLN